MMLKDRVAIVTGGGRGIGRETAELFAREGAKVTVAARSVEQLTEVVDTINNNGGAALGIVADVANENDARKIIDGTMQKFDRIDILVNNAGILKTGPIVSVDSDEWRRVIEVNLLGTFYCSKAVVPVLIERKWGRIINMSSRSGKIGRPYLTAYCASKHGVVGFTKALAEELGPFNITVNAICPGVVETEMVPDTIKEKMGTGMVAPRQVADLALYLASTKANTITGESINIFGGSDIALTF